jgi:hypothetical protein
LNIDRAWVAEYEREELRLWDDVQTNTWLSSKSTTAGAVTRQHNASIDNGLPQPTKDSNMNVNKLLDANSKYLKQSDLGADESVIVTVTKVEKVNAARDDADPEYKPAVLFKEFPKPMILNKTNIKRLARILGDDTDDWIGKTVTLYVDHEVEYGGETVGGLRVRPVPKQPSKKETDRAFSTLTIRCRSSHDDLGAEGAWLADRCGKLTASSMADAMCFLKNGQSGAPRVKLLHELLAERYTGFNAPHVVTDPMTWGLEHEDEAADLFVAMTGRDLRLSRLYDHPTIPYFAATPDRELDDGLVEIKCPTTSKFVAWRLAGIVPA